MGNEMKNTMNEEVRILTMASLAGAIINQAISDYASTKEELKRSAEKFFADPWFDTLCGNLDSSIFLEEAKRRRNEATIINAKKLAARAAKKGVVA